MWEYDCSGMVIRVLVPAALVSEVTWTDAWLLPATENRLPLKEACFCKTRWMLGLLEACCSCWLSIPWRKAFTTRICKIKQKIFQRLNFLIKSKFHVTDLGHNHDDILKRHGETILDGYRKSINLYDFKRETLDNFSQNVLHKFPEINRFWKLFSCLMVMLFWLQTWWQCWWWLTKNRDKNANST